MTATALQIDAAPSNRRNNGRRTVIKGATIVYNNRASTLSCRVRDMSDDGACLDFTTQQLLPHQFELQLAGQPARLCSLRWARGTKAGVWFVS